MGQPVVVVGGGVVGLCTAYYLRRSGADVVVVEGRRVGSGASVGNAGWIVPSMSAPLPGPGMLRAALSSWRDPDGAFYVAPRQVPGLLPWLARFQRKCNPRDQLTGLRAIAGLASSAMELFDGLEADDVPFAMQRNGLLFVGLTPPAVEHALAGLLPMREFGYEVPDAVLDGDGVRAAEPALGIRVQAGFFLRAERSVHPGSLVDGLSRRLAAMGVTVREDCPVEGFETSGDHLRAVRTRDGLIDAGAVVVAAGAWTSALVRRLGVRLPMLAGRGYSFSIASPAPPRSSLYLTEAKVGATPFGDRLRLAGTMELAQVAERFDNRRVEAISRAAVKYLQPCFDGPRSDEWSGLRPLTSDGLPVLGRLPTLRNAYVATGHGTLGVTLGPASGHALAQEILEGQTPPMLLPFAVSRFARRHRREDAHPASRRVRRGWARG